MERVLKEVLRVAVECYVRKEFQIEFLEKLYVLTNEYGSSTLWGAVQDVLTEYKKLNGQ